MCRKVTTKKDVQESTGPIESEELLEKLIDPSHISAGETKVDGSKLERIMKETTTTVTSTSGTSTPDVKTFPQCDLSGKSTPDTKHEVPVQGISEHMISSHLKDLISDDKSYSGKSSPDMSLPKDIMFSGSTGKSTPEIAMSPLIRDGAIPSHLSGRSTPDRKSDGRFTTATPEGFRSGEVIRTIITTTRTMSQEGEIITTTKEVTESTNEKGETIVIAAKTDVKVDEPASLTDIPESTIAGISPADNQQPSVHTPTYSDDETGYSSQTVHSFQHIPDEGEESMRFSTAAMSSSFYGALPSVPPTVKSFHGQSDPHQESDFPQDQDFSFKKFTIEKEYLASGHSERKGSKKYIDEADFDIDKTMLVERGETEETSGAVASLSGDDMSARYSNGKNLNDKDDDRDDSKKDPLAGWGTPLGLPSPKPPTKFNLRSSLPPTSGASSTEQSPPLSFDVVRSWGEPLRLPSPAPAPINNEVPNKGVPGTPKKDKKQVKKVISENIKNKKRSESPGRNDKKTKDSKNKLQPVYLDLTYVPHHGNSFYTSLEFFKRIRARYYVFSGTEPSREVYDALLEAKKTWEDKDLEVTMIPTYDTDTLGYWVADNEEALAANRIDLSPSASRCTINLQDHETSCSAYRLEF